MHQRLHGVPDFVALFERRLDRAGYRRLLARSYGYQLPLEQALRAATRPRTPWPIAVRPRVWRLVEDLRHLGLDDADIAGLPVAPALDFRSAGAALGALYVREGALMGGRLMAAHLAGLLGPGTAGRSFLGGDSGDRDAWQALCDGLDQAAESGALPAMIAGANLTFAWIEQWLKAAPRSG